MSVEYKIPSTVKHTLNAHKGTVYSVRYTSIGDYCISCGEDKLIQVFNPHAGTLVKTFEGHGKAIYDLCISKDSTKFASGGADRSVYLWDVEQGRNTKRFGGHSQRVNSVAFNEDASVLATGSYDAIVRLWDCRSNSHTPIQSLKNAKDSISSIEIFDKLIIAGSIDENIRIYDIRKGELTSDKMPAPVTNISLAKDCSFTCVNTLDNKIRLIDFRDGTLLNTFEDIKNESYKLHGELNNLDSHFICGSENGDILIYDILKPKPVKTLKAHSRGVIWTACNPKSDQMVSCSVDGTIKVWE